MSLTSEEPVSGEKTPVATDLSVVIAVRDPDKTAPLQELYHEYRKALHEAGVTYECIFALEGEQSVNVDTLLRLKEKGEPIRILQFNRWYGGATVLMAGFEAASAPVILTLPAYRQVVPEGISAMLRALDEYQMAVGRRTARKLGLWGGLQVRVFHKLLRLLSGFSFTDLGCSVVAFRKELLDVIDLYGDQHRFLPVLAAHYGFRVVEVDVPAAPDKRRQAGRSFATVIKRFFDLLSIFFLTTFTAKPLRFFGSIGVLSFMAGFGLSTYLAFQRLALGVPLADRPILLVGILLIVIGVLFVALGLIGEMIIFIHARKFRSYTVERVVEQQPFKETD